MNERQARVLDLAISWGRMMAKAGEVDPERDEEAFKQMSQEEIERRNAEAEYYYNNAQDYLENLEEAAIELDRSAQPNYDEDEAGLSSANEDAAKAEREERKEPIDFKDDIEHVMDRIGLLQTVFLFVEVCKDKADHVRTNWQDEITAERWETAAQRIEICVGNLPREL